MLSAPASAVRAGEEVSVTLVLLNSGTTSSAMEFPATLQAELIANDRSTHITLRRAGGGSPSPQVSAGGFAQSQYVVTMPTASIGRVIIEVESPIRASAVILIERSADAAPKVDSGKSDLSLSPSTQPALSAADQNNRSGFVEYFADHFSGHEPVYFLIGNERPNAKFQFSFKYRVLNPEGSWTKAVPVLGGLHLAYSQTSFWDLEGESKPFYDNSYRPEVLLAYDRILPKEWEIPGVSRLGLQLGVQHESNGRAGADSRSFNIAYVRPIFVFGDEKGLFLTLAPRVFSYLGSLDENSDIADYRGHADLRAVVGWDGRIQLAAIGRLGDNGDKGSLQLDLTYPLRQRLAGNVDIYLHAQFFTGFGESLLGYNDSDNVFRLGISMVR